MRSGLPSGVGSGVSSLASGTLATVGSEHPTLVHATLAERSATTWGDRMNEHQTGEHQADGQETDVVDDYDGDHYAGFGEWIPKEGPVGGGADGDAGTGDGSLGYALGGRV